MDTKIKTILAAILKYISEEEKPKEGTNWQKSGRKIIMNNNILVQRKDFSRWK